MAFWDEAGCKICVAESGLFFQVDVERGREEGMGKSSRAKTEGVKVF